MDFKMKFFVIIFLSFFVFFSFNVYAGISVEDNYNGNSNSNVFLSVPGMSVSDSSSKTVSVSCKSYSNVYDSLIAVAFFRKNSYGYDKLTAYDIDIKRKNGNSNIVFSHTVKFEGQYKVFCVEAYDKNSDGKFSADEIFISNSKIISVGSSNSGGSVLGPVVNVYDKGDYLRVVCSYSDDSKTYSYGSSGKVFVVLNGEEYLMPSLDKPVVYDGAFSRISWSPTVFVSVQAKVYPSTSSNSISCKVVDPEGKSHYSNVKKVYFNNVDSNIPENVDVTLYISPSSSSDGRFYYSCSASGNDDFSKGTFYLKVGFDEVVLDKGFSGSYYNVYNSAPDNSRAGYYNLYSKGSSKGSYGVHCKYVSSSGSVFYSVPKTFTYE